MTALMTALESLPANHRAPLSDAEMDELRAHAEGPLPAALEAWLRVGGLTGPCRMMSEGRQPGVPNWASLDGEWLSSPEAILNHLRYARGCSTGAFLPLAHDGAGNMLGVGYGDEGDAPWMFWDHERDAVAVVHPSFLTWGLHHLERTNFGARTVLLTVSTSTSGEAALQSALASLIPGFELQWKEKHRSRTHRKYLDEATMTVREQTTSSGTDEASTTLEGLTIQLTRLLTDDAPDHWSVFCHFEDGDANLATEARLTEALQAVWPDLKISRDVF
jgi:hypothetical protein